MHDHDHDSIIDLLDEPGLSQPEILARLDDCHDCLADLNQQRSMMAMLADLPAATMTDRERSELRAAVSSELDASVVTPLRPARGFDWMRVGTVAAAFLGLVVVVGLGSNLMSSGDAGDNGALAAFDTSDDAADGDGADVTMAATESMDDAAGDLMEEAAEAPEAGTAIAPTSDLVVDFGAVTASEFSERLARLTDEVGELGESSPILRRLVDPDRVQCLDQIDDLGAIRALATAIVDGTDIEAYVTLDGETTVLNSTDCSPAELD